MFTTLITSILILPQVNEAFSALAVPLHSQRGRHGGGASYMHFQEHSRLIPENGEKLCDTPELGYCSGVYFLIDCDHQVVYVGQSRCVARRIATHSSGPIPFQYVAWFGVADDERLKVERRMIEKYRPVYNDANRRETLIRKTREMLETVSF